VAECPQCAVCASTVQSQRTKDFVSPVGKPTEGWGWMGFLRKGRKMKQFNRILPKASKSSS
jgi:hypothetical protein